MPVELHYSQAKLRRMVAIGAALAAAALWLALDSSIISDSRVGTRLVRAVGPDLPRLAFLILAAASAAMAALHLRLLLSAGSLAARADAGGVTLRSLFGTRSHPWPEVEALYVRRVATPAAEQVLVVLRARGRREAGVAVNSLEEDAGEAEAWVEAAEQMRLAAAEDPVTVT